MAAPPRQPSVQSTVPPGVLILGLLALACGCQVPRAVPSYEFLTRYDRMSDEHDPLVSLVYLPEPERLSDYGTLLIGEVSVGQGWVECQQEAAGYARMLRLVLQKELRTLDRFAHVTLDAASPESGDGQAPALLLEGAITRFDTGSGWQRYFSYFLWFLQSGATDFQLEGRLTDARSGETLIEFVDRRRGIYNTAFGPNPRTFRGEFAMSLTVRDTARSLAAFIAQTHEGKTARAGALTGAAQ